MSSFEMTDRAVATILEKVTANSVLLPEALHQFVLFKLITGVLGLVVCIALISVGVWVVRRCTAPFYKSEDSLEDPVAIPLVIMAIIGAVVLLIGAIGIISNYDTWLAGFFPDALMMDYIKDWTKLK